MRPTRPPTRVNNACDRCRRQKQRCDDFRPCSNCLHSRYECENSELIPPNKKLRQSKRASSQNVDKSLERGLANIRPGPKPGEMPREPSHRYASSEHDTEQFGRPTSQRQYLSSDGDEQRHEQTVLMDLHGSESAVGITNKILGFANNPPADRATFAIPGGDAHRRRGPPEIEGRLLPISQIIGIDLPSREISDALVDTYFYTVHWFSLVLYEPKFRVRYGNLMNRGLAHPSDHAFLLLLVMVMVMGCWYGPGVLPPETALTVDLTNMRHDFLKLVRERFMDLIDEDCLEFVQLCALLGSYWLYWGRPRSSFSILGAAIKSAQALELHRDPVKGLSLEDSEERKRIWWTIYTWDRFATIIYGRPLGINDKDCNVSAPASYPEDISFESGNEPAQVSLSPYQIQLNRAYQITSPLLENIYGIRYSTDRSLRSQMPSMVSKIDQLLQVWQDDLPPHLHLDKHDDITLTSSIEEKMHRLQALSLQMTYDNLIIVIHRPLLADQSRRSSRTQKNNEQQHMNSVRDPAESRHTDSTKLSFQRCLDSALRISRIQQEKRNLLALARRTHLVSFLGMNLFTSSVVMFICALSDTLSDIAQEAKRGMARNLKMLKLLSGDGSLSMQCSMILEDLVQKIVDKEKEEMLQTVPSDDEMAPFLPTRRNSYIDGHSKVIGVGTGSQTAWQTIDGLGSSHEDINENTSGLGNSALQQTMASLQKVFKEVTVPRPPFPSTGFDINHSSQETSHHSQSQQIQQRGSTLEHAGFVFDGSNFSTEDLGQFWLWNMDPLKEDSSTWHSGDEYA